MHFGVAVDFAGAGLEESGLLRLGETQRVVRAERADLEGLNREVEVIDWASRAGEVQHVVDQPLDLERLRDVVSDEAKLRVVAEAVEVAELAGDEVIDANDLVPFGEEALAQVRTDEAAAAGNQGAQRRSSNWWFCRRTGIVMTAARRDKAEGPRMRDDYDRSGKWLI